MAVIVIKGLIKSYEVEDGEDIKIGEPAEIDATLGTVKTATSGTALCVGVVTGGWLVRDSTGALPTEDTITSGEMVDVQFTGIVKIENAGLNTISAGDYVQVGNSNGQIMSASTTKNGVSIGKAIEKTTTADAEIKVILGVS